MAGALRTRGFTLVETLVAIAMLSGVLVASHAAVSGALAMAVHLRDRGEALEIVARQAALLRAVPARLMRDLAGDTPAYRWRLTVVAIPRAGGGRQVAVTPYRLVGSITRKAGSGRREVVLDTVVLGHGT